MSKYYIMCATGQGNLFTTPQTIVNAVKREWSNGPQTVLVAKREVGYGRFKEIFVFGYGHGYENGLCTSSYTEDTGNGYRNQGSRLIIENIVTIKDGEIVESVNDVGLNEKRRVWVMK